MTILSPLIPEDVLINIFVLATNDDRRPGEFYAEAKWPLPSHGDEPSSLIEHSALKFVDSEGDTSLSRPNVQSKEEQKRKQKTPYYPNLNPIRPRTNYTIYV